jgi:asparagine synthase (glutamine-hydrolysing)
MSGIAGVWNFDGRRVARDLISTLGASVAHRGEDYAGTWCADGVGFAARVRRIAPESACERQPVVDRSGTALVFDGRLDNRDELLRQLPTPGNDPEESDVGVIFRAFRMWGDACLEKLAGDFALAAYSPDEKRLVLARDPVGCRPLYYWCDGKTLVFGSEIKAILAHTDVRAEPNEDLLADFLLRDLLPYEDEGDTFFQGIRAVLPGCRVSVSARGIHSKRFWDFNPQIKTRYASYAEYADRLRELLIQAVKRRLRTNAPVAIAVSGGLDSSVVLCIADDLLKSRAVNTPVSHVSCVSHRNGQAEEQRLGQLLESTRGVSIDRIAMGPPGNREQLGGLVWHSEWPRFDDNWCAWQPMLAHVRNSGARTMMTGHWSDQLFFVTGYLSDLFARVSWRQVAGHLREYGRWFVDADPGYFRSRFRRELALNLTPHEWRARLRPLLKTRRRHGSERLVSPAFAARLERPRARIARPRAASAHARDIYQFVRAQSHRIQFEADEKLAAGCGVEAVTPFLDRDLIAYLMSIPGDVQNHGGVPRALLRDSMRGIVPEAILERRWRDDDAALVAGREAAYLSPPLELDAAERLGFLQDAAPVDRASMKLVGLEFWSRVFFSDRLASLRPPPHGVSEPMDTVVTPGKDDREKLPYSPPKLTVHGDLRTITAAKNSDRSEAGQPKTFNSGMP